MNPLEINYLFASDVTIQNMLGIGCSMKYSDGGLGSSNNFDSVIHSSSSVGSTDWYDFTFEVYVTAFAPFDWFGPLQLSGGDGLTRRFGYNRAASYRLQCFSTVHVTPGEREYYWRRRTTVTKVSDPTTSTLLVPLPRLITPGFVLPGGVFPKIANSPGHLKNEEHSTDFDLPESDSIRHKSNDRLKFHFYGNDDAFAIAGKHSWVASDIDVHPNINFKYTPDRSNPKNISMRVYGNIVGDQFPAVESYLIDKNNNGVMIGVWQVREGDGPVFTRNGRFGIVGDKRLPMIDFDFKVNVEDGVFKTVIRDGRNISLAEHNQHYTNLPTIKSSGSPTDPKPVPRPTPTPRM